MSKAVLVMDMPEKCKYCPFQMVAYDSDLFEEGECFCCFECQTVQEYVDKDKKADWCPLRELPERKDVAASNLDTHVYRAEGWNDCLDAILEEV